MTVCLAGANDTYETVLAAWDENVLRLAADEQEQLREEAIKTAAEKTMRSSASFAKYHTLKAAQAVAEGKTLE